MRNMKHTYYKIVGAFLALTGLTTSCSDFLEIEPLNEIIRDNFWNEKADVDNIMAGCYSRLQADDIVSRMIVWGEVRSDNCVAGQNVQSDASLENVFKENINASNEYTKYEGFYEVINRCNIILQEAPGVAEKDPSYSDSELQATIAEASALRDLCYFYLIRAFRNVPYTTQAFTDDYQDFELPATPFYDVLDSLILDLEKVRTMAVRRYPTASGTKQLYQTGRITQDVIHAMLCEMYLWKQDYQNCVKYADLVIQSKKDLKEDNLNRTNKGRRDDDDEFLLGYPLVSERQSGSTSIFGSAYSRVFGTGNSDESIFELTYMKDNDNMLSNNAINRLYGNTTNAIGFIAPSDYVGTDVKEERYEVFKKKRVDVRPYEWFNSDGSGIQKFVVREVRVDIQRTESSSGGASRYESTASNRYADGRNKSNWIIYRLSDIMLMKAEALVQMMSDDSEEMQNEYNQDLVQQAFLLVNTINKRATCEYPLKDTLTINNYNTKATMGELVMEERQRELMFEGKRWFDLVRRSLRDDDTSFLISQVNKKGMSNSSAVANKLKKMDAIFWPYYKDELNVNKNLVQNPAFGSGEDQNYEQNR